MAKFDSDPIVGPQNWESQQWRRATKKPVTVLALQLEFPEGFTVTTKHGKVAAKKGDYLVIAPDGDRWPVDREVFERTYEIEATAR